MILQAGAGQKGAALDNSTVRVWRLVCLVQLHSWLFPETAAVPACIFDKGARAMSGSGKRKRPAVGDRVGAILCTVKEEAKFLGYGVYVGDFVPQEAKGWFAQGIKAAGQVNPRLDLDNGQRVYGCECWWGSEEEIRELLTGCQVTMVDIDQVRAAQGVNKSAEALA